MSNNYQDGCKAWLIIVALLLTGCAMKWDGKTHIGGLETGPALRRFDGDQGICAKYEYQARVLLGELKMQMQLGGIKSGITRKTLEDGVKLYAMSNMWGLADIDEIGIDVTSLEGSSAIKYKVTGYIVQGFISNDEAGNETEYIDFKAVTPSGKRIGYLFDMGNAAQTKFDDYPDNGAKYVTNVNHADYQDVYVKYLHQTSKVTGSPITYNATPNPAPLGVLNTGWVLTSTYQYSSGTCGVANDGTPATWSSEAIPCEGSIQSSRYTKYLPNGLTEEVTLGDGEPFIDYVVYYTGSWYQPYGQYPWCFKTYDNPWIADTHQERYSTRPTAWIKANLVAKYAEKTNAAQALSYESYIANNPLTDSDVSTYITLSPFNIKRREDGNGVLTEAGFSINSSGIVLDRMAPQNGAGALFMMPTGNSRTFSLANEIIKTNTYNAEYSNKYSIGSGSYGPTMCVTPYGSNAVWPGVEDGFYAINPENMTLNGTAETAVSANFGIPIEVESGEHVITVWRSSTYVYDPAIDDYVPLAVSKLKIYLFVEGVEGNGIHEIVIDDVMFDENKYEWNKQISINLKEIDSLDNLASLVKLIDYTPTA